MEQNIQGLGKKMLQIARVALFMLKKGICKKKIFLELNMTIKRGKVARKSFRNLMFHHHSAADDHHFATAAAEAGEYEFSCSDTPLHRRFFTAGHSKRKPHQLMDDNSEATINRVLEIVMKTSSSNDVAASPVVPGSGFGRSPVARQLRVTDSPFPLQDNPDESSRVDQAAEDFINMFYSQLKQQKYY